jgi:hypothetical protein
MDYMVKECKNRINNEIVFQKTKKAAGNSLEEAKMRS